MNFNNAKKVVVVDYGLGNLFSVERALKYVGAETTVTSEVDKIENADYLILPGVGAFSDGMKGLEKRNLIEPIIKFLKNERPLMGICLGMQLLMTVSEEFGTHQGLNLVSGKVVRLTNGTERIKIPHIGWNSVLIPGHAPNSNGNRSFPEDSILENVKPGMFMYFVHSYMVIPDNPLNIMAETEYGDNVFCSVLRKDNLFACQFHPERSGEVGLEIYKQFLKM